MKKPKQYKLFNIALPTVPRGINGRHNWSCKDRTKARWAASLINHCHTKRALIQYNFNGSNTFATTKICSRQG